VILFYWLITLFDEFILSVIMLPGTVDLASKLELIMAMLQLEHDPPALGSEDSCNRKTKLDDVPID
jgi:hypothetical protein